VSKDNKGAAGGRGVSNLIKPPAYLSRNGRGRSPLGQERADRWVCIQVQWRKARPERAQLFAGSDSCGGYLAKQVGAIPAPPGPRGGAREDRDSKAVTGGGGYAGSAVGRGPARIEQSQEQERQNHALPYGGAGMTRRRALPRPAQMGSGG